MTSQARKVERLADQVAEMERRLARMDGQMQGFLAGATALLKVAQQSDKGGEPRQTAGSEP